MWPLDAFLISPEAYDVPNVRSHGILLWDRRWNIPFVSCVGVKLYISRPPVVAQPKSPLFVGRTAGWFSRSLFLCLCFSVYIDHRTIGVAACLRIFASLRMCQSGSIILTLLCAYVCIFAIKICSCVVLCICECLCFCDYVLMCLCAFVRVCVCVYENVHARMRRPFAGAHLRSCMPRFSQAALCVASSFERMQHVAGQVC